MARLVKPEVRRYYVADGISGKIFPDAYLTLSDALTERDALNIAADCVVLRRDDDGEFVLQLNRAGEAV